MRDAVISVLVEAREKEQIARAAEVRGMTLSSFLRRAGLRLAREVARERARERDEREIEEVPK